VQSVVWLAGLERRGGGGGFLRRGYNLEEHAIIVYPEISLPHRESGRRDFK